MTLFDLDRLEVPALIGPYRLAEPFPHVVLEDFARVAASDVVGAFPDADWDGWSDRSSPFQPKKRSCRDIDKIPPLLGQMIHESRVPRPAGRVDPDGDREPAARPVLGGRRHPVHHGRREAGPAHRLPRAAPAPALPAGQRPGLLEPRLGAWGRRRARPVQSGGRSTAVSVPPRFGTCVIFTTDHRSVHGVSPVAQWAAPRRSIALYYYSVEPAEVFSGDRKTLVRPSPTVRTGRPPSRPGWWPCKVPCGRPGCSPDRLSRRPERPDLG